MNAQTRDTVPSGGVNILSMDNIVKTFDNDVERQYFKGNVVLRHDQVYIYCDSGNVDGKIIRAFGNVVIKQGDTLNIFGDQLYYDGYVKIADLENNVVLENRDQRLFTQKLRYDVNTKIATYNQKATLTDNKTYLKSIRGTYHANTNDAFFQDSVVVIDPGFSLKTEQLQYNTDAKMATFLAPTMISFEKSKIYTEGGYYKVQEKYALFNKNPQYLSETSKAKSDTIIYDGTLKEVKLLGNAFFEEEETKATADTMHFYELKDIVELIGNANYADGSRTASGDKLIYDRKNKIFRSDTRIKILDGAQSLEADITDFNSETGEGMASGKVDWQDTTQNIRILTEDVVYNKKEDYVKASGDRPLLVIELDGKKLFVSGDTLISKRIANPNRILSHAEKGTLLIDTLAMIYIQDTSHLLQKIPLGVDSILRKPKMVISSDSIEKEMMDSDSGMVVKDKMPEEIPEMESDKMVVDSSEKKDVIAVDSMTAKTDSIASGETKSKRKKKKKAEEKLVEDMKAKPTQDSIPPVVEPADTIKPAVNIGKELVWALDSPPDSFKIILVYPNVKIFGDDLQGVCDSLAFNTLDSMFHFYNDPVLWSDTTQFHGDTIRMLVKEKKLHSMDILNNGMIISTPNQIYFDQMKGKLINAWFVEGAIDNVLITGNAETIYYVTDESGAYNGANKKQCSKMRMTFLEKKLDNIRFYDKPEGTYFPMNKADPATMKLEGFIWSWDLKPKDIPSLTDQKWIDWTQFDPVPEVEIIEEETQKEDSDLEGKLEDGGQEK
jgi:lipopolysaccharide export system protein LptA